MPHKRLFSDLPNQATFHAIQDLPGPDGFEEGADVLRRLAAAVILAACRDAAGKRKGKGDLICPEAKAWLLDPENEWPWFDLAGISREVILAWVREGCSITQHLKKRIWTGNLRRTSRKKKYFSEYELKTKPPEKKAPIDPDLGPEY